MENGNAFRAARSTAVVFGILAGLGGLTHGIGEVLQGNIKPGSILIDSWTRGPIAAHMGGEPAMTVVPNLRITGILTILVSLALVVRAALLRERKHGQGLLFLSAAMLLVGGGFGPPLLGILAGVAGNGIGRPSAWWEKRHSTGVAHLLARLWPWIFALAVVNGVFLVVGSVILVFLFGMTNGDLFTNSFYVSVASVSLTIFVGRLYDEGIGGQFAVART